MTDYSQYGEQEHIIRALVTEQMNPYGSLFFDVGAYHPTDMSNTRALYEAGWNGVMFEPSPGPIQNIMAEYGDDPRIQLVQAAVTTIDECGQMLRMRITQDGLSTDDEANIEKWDGVAKWQGWCWVPTITIPQILNQFGHAAFWNIDVEGRSADLFMHLLDLSEPEVICVEHDNRLAEILQKATAKGYHAVHVNATNAVVAKR